MGFWPQTPIFYANVYTLGLFCPFLYTIAYILAHFTGHFHLSKVGTKWANGHFFRAFCPKYQFLDLLPKHKMATLPTFLAKSPLSKMKMATKLATKISIKNGIYTKA